MDLYTSKEEKEMLKRTNENHDRLRTKRILEEQMREFDRKVASQRKQKRQRIILILVLVIIIAITIILIKVSNKEMEEAYERCIQEHTAVYCEMLQNEMKN